MHKSILILILLSLNQITWSQNANLNIVLIDEITKEPIEDAHVFINNSSFGSVSNKNGSINIAYPERIKGELIISHLSYDSKIVAIGSDGLTGNIDSIFLNPNGVKLEEVVLAKKRPKGWKKNFKKFKKAFLGTGKAASKCKILNPEVLRFSNYGGKFITTAIDLITIENNYLGYTIDFLLKDLTIDKNGSIKYLGYANFTDSSTDKNQKKTTKTRAKTYDNSLQHFCKHLINDDLENGGYEIKLARYAGGEFRETATPTVNELVQFDPSSQNYILRFDNFLHVTHLNLEEISSVNVGVGQGRTESTRFTTRTDRKRTKKTHPVSQLFKVAGQLIIDQNGNILNHRAVQEYGYWAELRMANKLPIDYGNEFRINDPITRNNENQNSTVDAEVEVQEADTIKSLDIIQDLLYGDQEVKASALDIVRNNWDDRFVSPLLDFWRFNRITYLHQEITALLKEKTGIKDYYSGLQWVWEYSTEIDSDYGNVKAEIYQHIDTKFKKYFLDRQPSSTIKMDEIVWGGVKQDGIPPLRNPEMISVEEAEYLADSDIVFGISIDEDHRAYPKRILAWHEFFVDEIADNKVAGVYCTLCGTMIAYDMEFGGQFHDLGTSGFLYRSNKLMYDKATQSLWSTIEGRPVLGPLTESNITLETYAMTTTTWGEWKKLHPDTKVLSLNTGHDRDYSEGEAYKEYFATDALMFPVPKIDRQLKNKDEVLVIRTDGYEEDPIAVSIDYLKQKRMYQGSINGKHFVVISEKDGASRAYDASDFSFKKYKNGLLIDSNGNSWSVSEGYISGPTNQKLNRIPAHNAFWFGWYNAFPNTRLIK